MSNGKKLYIIGGAIFVAAVIVSLISSEIEFTKNENSVSIESNVEEPVRTITGTPADNYNDDERPTHCGSPDEKSNAFIIEYEIPTPCTQPVSILVDAQQKVWFTQSNTGKLAKFDPKTLVFTEFENENWPKGSNSMTWGITQTDDNEIWFSDERHDALWRFSINDEKYSSYKFEGNHTITFPQMIVQNEGKFLVNDFYGNKISIIDHKELDAGDTTPMPILIPENFFAGPTVVDKIGNIWFIGWKYQSTISLIKVMPGTFETSVFDLTGKIQAPNGLSIDKNNNLWITDTATSNFLKFEPKTQDLTTYITSFPREITYGNSSGLIKTPITRPYWNIIDDGLLIFNEQTANTIGIFDLKAEKLVEYLVPSKNPKWADCGESTDCGVAQVFGFTKSGEKIWFTEWAENNIAVLDLSIELPLQLQLDTKRINIEKGKQETIIAKIIPNDGFQNNVKISSTLAGEEVIQVSFPNKLINNEITDVPVEISVSDLAKPGTYKILISITQPDVTISEFVTVNVI